MDVPIKKKKIETKKVDPYILVNCHKYRKYRVLKIGDIRHRFIQQKLLIK